MNTRIIAKLDVKPPYVVKPVHFEGLRKVGEPANLAKKYFSQGADELFYIDIVSSLYQRKILPDEIIKTANELFIPFAVGGGVKNIEDFSNLLHIGADKVVINSYAVQHNPNIINKAAEIFGNQAVVVNIEAKKIDVSSWEAYKFCGREKTNLNLIDWINTIHDKGCGEILLTSIDKEGTETGFDIDLINNVHKIIKKPLIVSGGCGNLNHIQEVKKRFKDVSVAVASVLHYKTLKISEIKKIFL
jgi:cyclase